VTATVGVERAEQAPSPDRLGEAAQARERPFFLDQEGRIDLGRGVVHGHDQVERRLPGQPGVARAVLKQQHARQRPARPLPAVRRALPCPPHQARVLQHPLGPGVAEREAVLRHELLVKVLHREVEVARAELLQHPLDAVDRHPPARDPAAPPVDQPLRPFGLVAIAQAAEVPLAHPQHLRRFQAAQRPAPPSADRLDDPRHPYLRQHPTPPARPNRTDRVLRNPDIPRATDKS
jgi:hypothetical protein